MLGSDVDSGQATASTPAAAGGPRARRSVGGRLSLGHVLPLALAVVAGLLVLAGLKDRSATEAVAVATHSISAGQPLTAADFRWVSVHRSDGSVVTGLLSPSDAAGPWVAAVDIPGGAPVALGELTRSSPALGLGSMSIQVPPSHADGGALQPGDRVDVISAASGQAVYLATDLEVLAVDQAQGGVLGSVQDSSYYVTVAVDRATALRLAAALGASNSGGASTLELVRSTGEAVDPGAVYQPAPAAGGRG
ncbi:MAG: RcpC/CpaB family pilus assembly protein [Acidimicrobiales bacterium]